MYRDLVRPIVCLVIAETNCTPEFAIGNSANWGSTSCQRKFDNSTHDEVAKKADLRATINDTI
jgi:hypothetical protein